MVKRSILAIFVCLFVYRAGYSQDTAGLIYSGFYFEDTTVTGFPEVEIVDSNGTVCRAVYYKESFKTCRLKPGFYSIIAKHPAYHTIRINTIRVRANQVTFQNIKFLNIYKRQDGDEPGIINLDAWR
ncbi:MAG TPA: hypothetical protein VEC12_06000 [Bacteroidia bacterium]|nr:hypothetical protein [Bacteroidia bacterium]